VTFHFCPQGSHPFTVRLSRASRPVTVFHLLRESLNRRWSLLSEVVRAMSVTRFTTLSLARIRAGTGTRLPKSVEAGATLSEAGAKKQPRTSVRARLRPKAQLTLPDAIRRALHVNEGDEVEFAVHENGIITVRGYVSVPSDQAWYFAPERQVASQQADEEIAAGRGTAHGSAEAMFAYLDTLGAADDLWQPLRSLPIRGL
jgi:antitoxin PrlF